MFIAEQIFKETSDTYCGLHVGGALRLRSLLNVRLTHIVSIIKTRIGILVPILLPMRL